ncbi:alpha-hydroxy acid oxidase [Parapusillimonas sp. JC17]|uniref:alpha-hydroxy acid oxidase n=1 Tax=Parapusillimonas sp. JC17 TaxID=3445768 RepID=UPI003FA160CF
MLFSKRELNSLLCLDDFERAARGYLPRSLFAYVSGGVETNASLAQNRAVFQEFGFVPRVMRDVSSVNTEIDLWGDTYKMPFGIAPMGLSALTAYDGDCALARAACNAGIPMIMSGSSLTRMEEVSGIGPNVWFQAYLPGTLEQIEALMERVQRAGFQKLVITVDTPVAANRENNIRAGFSTPLRPSVGLALDGILHPRWTLGTFLRTLLAKGMPHFENNYATRGAPILSRHVLRDLSDRSHLNWDYFKRIRELWHGRLIVKGVLSASDARYSVDAGADAIIVSNHGGRQLDGSLAPLRVLPSIVEACPNVPVMMDSGVRRGTDVVKALALGAHCVFVGRPFAYAAAVGGEAGVARAIDLLAVELRRNLAMLGITHIEGLDAACVQAITPGIGWVSR